MYKEKEIFESFPYSKLDKTESIYYYEGYYNYS